MKNLSEIRERYLRDSVSIRLGGLAANLARVSSFSKNPANQDAVNNLLEESKHFIEWTAKETDIETAAELAEIQVQVAVWQIKWQELWQDVEKRIFIAETSANWSKKVLEKSGLLNK
jgi:vancomycin resistance protein YoaR